MSDERKGGSEETEGVVKLLGKNMKEIIRCPWC